ncbi:MULTISPECIES: flagellar hook-length control protein FliK [unclassified Pseudomonas]|uniref:flagellar hook-length control protein FliK n=1 Tax=unclassified Pseudomonas TaxID=196821 RepID=UPI000C87EDCC|nr:MULTISPECIES: flagellar hook-length control protein FliK [unclassified Pseudomonas]PMZ91664.1 flagellar hook-length control protein FliK [Pseudomonas sp. FW215-T2]PNA14309.1 flagellar hook-length control protein FliK [Pseudomonas sp. FW215-R3]PNB38910.1 flagellar hook-length control protein FliK [Pseudomonas sp. FW305-131]
MPVTPDILLPASRQAKTQAGSANPPAQTAEPGGKAASFADVYADQAQSKPTVLADASLKPGRDKTSDVAGTKDAGDDRSAAEEPVVADGGKSLPAGSSVQAGDKVAGDDASDADPAPVVNAALPDPALDPSLQSIVSASVAPAVVDTVQPVVDAPVAATATAVLAPALATAVDDFDPSTDPLDALPAVRLAMEQGGHVSASSQAQPKAAPTQAQAPADAELTSEQNFAAGMATLLDVKGDKSDTSPGEDKAFSGLIDDGLKDLKSASNDTRVDDFASRLAALTQAATPKTANALPVNQPIAMHQSGWTEEVVNRVMYLSSANLKAADIQLQPAELGRLDIRVNMVPDQQTQVTFMSAHPGVREALDGQVHRLRDMFAQQGMGQVDVNVSDQSRGSQQGQEQARQGQSGRTSATGGRLDSMDDDITPSVAEAAVNTTSVIGSSAVDYYA